MRSGNIIKAAAFGGSIPSVERARSAAPTRPGASAAPSAPEHEHEPEIKLHREGDEIVAIEVLCGCGRTTFIECQYGTETPSP